MTDDIENWRWFGLLVVAFIVVGMLYFFAPYVFVGSLFVLMNLFYPSE